MLLMGLVASALFVLPDNPSSSSDASIPGCYDIEHVPSSEKCHGEHPCGASDCCRTKEYVPPHDEKKPGQNVVRISNYVEGDCADGACRRDAVDLLLFSLPIGPAYCAYTSHHPCGLYRLYEEVSLCEVK